LGIQIAMIEDAPAGLRVLIPPDRGTAPAFLRAQMDAVKDAPCQVVLQATVLPEGRGGKVPGWTVIDLSAATRTKAKAPSSKGEGKGEGKASSSTTKGGGEGANPGNGQGAADTGTGGGQAPLIGAPPITVIIE
jgi:hypothetical protein